MASKLSKLELRKRIEKFKKNPQWFIMLHQEAEEEEQEEEEEVRSFDRRQLHRNSRKGVGNPLLKK